MEAQLVLNTQAIDKVRKRVNLLLIIILLIIALYVTLSVMAVVKARKAIG